MLKEEFFPLMGEIKGYISTLTFAGKGIFYGSRNKTPNLFWKRFSTKKPLLQIFLFVRTPGVWQSSFSHPACAENWKLHECSEYLIQGMWNVPCLKILEAYSVYLITGWVRRQCNRLPNGLFVEVGRHQSKQTRNESYALCCDGTCILSIYAMVVLFAYSKIFLSQFFLITVSIFMCLDFITAIPEGRFDPSYISRRAQTHRSCVEVKKWKSSSYFMFFILTLHPNLFLLLNIS